MDKQVEECKTITRIEVIDSKGRAYVSGSYRTYISLQDDGRTLKVFIKERPYREVILL